MKRLLLTCTALMLFYTVAVHAATWSIVGSCSQRDDGDDNNSSCTLSGTLAAGDVVAVFPINISGTTDVTSVTLNSGSETLTLAGPTVSGSNEVWQAYTVSTTQSGSVTVNVTWAGTVTNPKCVMAYSARATGAHTYESTESDTGSGTSATIATGGTVTVSGGDRIGFAAATHQTANITATEIMNVASDGTISPTGACRMWYKLEVGAATDVMAGANGNASNVYAIRGMMFSEAVGGGSCVADTNLLGVIRGC